MHSGPPPVFSANGGRIGALAGAELAERLPASLPTWDLLAHPELGDVRGRPYTERRALLLDLLHDVPPPIQAVPATDDPEVAQLWYDTLQSQGIEGVVCKRATSPYRAGRIWKKVRHADTVDADVVGYVGPASRPYRVAVWLPDGSRVLSQVLSALVAAEIARRVLDAGPGRRARTSAGEAYVTTSRGLVVEVLAGTTRHAVVTVTRLRYLKSSQQPNPTSPVSTARCCAVCSSTWLSARQRQTPGTPASSNRAHSPCRR
ncbi:ATP-dependent DNA ligase [Streptomyces sp. NPDC055817]